MTFEDLMDEVDGRLIRAKIAIPDASPFFQSLHKHVKFALNNPSQVDQQKLLRKSQGWLTAMSVKYPQFQEHLMPIAEKIKRYVES